MYIALSPAYKASFTVKNTKPYKYTGQMTVIRGHLSSFIRPVEIRIQVIWIIIEFFHWWLVWKILFVKLFEKEITRLYGFSNWFSNFSWAPNIVDLKTNLMNCLHHHDPGYHLYNWKFFEIGEPSPVYNDFTMLTNS